jgi:hypothetical protein
MPTDRTDPDAPQDPPQDQGPAMDDTQADATGRLADQLDAVDDDDLED